MQIHLLFRVSCCHDYFLESSVAALSINADRHLMAIYNRAHSKLSECCHPIVTRCAALSVPFIWNAMKPRFPGVQKCNRRLAFVPAPNSFFPRLILKHLTSVNLLAGNQAKKLSQAPGRKYALLARNSRSRKH
jgi:hypothetical protein